MERQESHVDVNTAQGVKRITVLSAVSVDDLLRVMTKAYIHGVRSKAEYSSPITRGVRDLVVNLRVAQRR